MRHVQTKSISKGKEKVRLECCCGKDLPQSLLELSQSTFVLHDGKEGTSSTFICPDRNTEGVLPQKWMKQWEHRCAKCKISYAYNRRTSGSMTTSKARGPALHFSFLPYYLIFPLLFRKMIQTRRFSGIAAGTGQIKGLRKMLRRGGPRVKSCKAKSSLFLSLSFFLSFFIGFSVRNGICA